MEKIILEHDGKLSEARSELKNQIDLINERIAEENADRKASETHSFEKIGQAVAGKVHIKVAGVVYILAGTILGFIAKFF